jgi:hypothetical protein
MTAGCEISKEDLQGKDYCSNDYELSSEKETVQRSRQLAECLSRVHNCDDDRGRRNVPCVSTEGLNTLVEL